MPRGNHFHPQRATPATLPRILIVFDFDYTIVDACSDTYVQRLAPNGGIMPDYVSQLYSPRGFIKYMSAVFAFLHKNCGVTPEKLLNCVAGIQLVPGMRELIEYLATLTSAGRGNTERPIVDVQNIIVSDGNSVSMATVAMVFSERWKKRNEDNKRKDF
jgi:hypothetical protein